MRTWAKSLRAFLSPQVIALLFLGFSAGVPLLLVFGTLSVWLRDAGVERSSIGFFSWAALAYAFKVVWAPLVNQLPLPLLGRVLGQRRSWLLVAQLTIILALILKALNDPATDLTMAAVLAVMLAFASATQDIVIDAYRIEAAPPDMQGLMNAAYVAGYRLGMIVASAGALNIAGFFDPDPDTYHYEPWFAAWLAMAGVMAVGVITTLRIAEPRHDSSVYRAQWSIDEYVRFLGTFAAAAGVFAVVFSQSGGAAAELKAAIAVEGGAPGPLTGFIVEAMRLGASVVAATATGIGLVRIGIMPRDMARESYVAPFTDLFHRYGRPMILVLALVSTYRIADVVMGVMAQVFYVDLGFEKEEIGFYSGVFGLIMTILGGFVGGVLITRYGIPRIMLAGALLAAATNLLFAWLAVMGKIIWGLAVAIAADNIAGGLASVALVAYLSSLTSTRFTATQYALFTSLMLLLPKLIAGYSGVAVDAVGYPAFFIGTAILGVPVLLLVLLAGGISTIRDGTQD